MRAAAGGERAASVEKSVEVLKKLKIEASHNPGIPLVTPSPKELKAGARQILAIPVHRTEPKAGATQVSSGRGNGLHAYSGAAFVLAEKGILTCAPHGDLETLCCVK